MTTARTTPPHVARLWSDLYPHVAYRPVANLPSCAREFKVWVYDLNRTFNGALLDSMERRRGTSSCDYERAACVESTRSRSRPDGWDYSNLRQYAAEVPLLAKLLRMQHAATPQDADLIVVPWLASTELSGHAYTPWYPRNQRTAARFEQVRSALTHLESTALASRHLFLSSRDWTFSIAKLKELVASSGALLVTYGPSTRPTEIVAAPNSAGFGLPLRRLVHPARFFVFAMMDESINPIRRDYGRELRRLNASRPDLGVAYHPIGDHRSIPLPPQRVHSLMSRSLLCPIVQGDLPYQHRLFDALVAGCVPLFLRYNALDAKGQPCEAWSWDAQNKSAMRPVARATLPFTVCARQQLPFFSRIDWSAISAHVPADALREGRLAEAIASLDRAELERKRRRLEALRGHFIYEWDESAAAPDAFSSTMAEICGVLRAQRHRAWRGDV